MIKITSTNYDHCDWIHWQQYHALRSIIDFTSVLFIVLLVGMPKPWRRPVCRYPDYTYGIPRIIPAFPPIILNIAQTVSSAFMLLTYARQISLHRGKLLISPKNIPNVAQLVNYVYVQHIFIFILYGYKFIWFRCTVLYRRMLFCGGLFIAFITKLFSCKP